MLAMTKDYRGPYQAQKAKLDSGVELTPPAISSLPATAQARLNRALISRGCVAVWWDGETQQELLAQSFVPAIVGKHVDRTYPATAVGAAVRRVHESLDRRGHPAFPELTREERTVAATLSISASLAERIGYTERLRRLGWLEQGRWLKLHQLSRNAGLLELNTGEC
jgi:hypothetical protein